MPVNVIDTLKPKNNGEFAVVEAVDVAVSSGKRLPAALAEKADASALAETNTAVQSKANASDVETKTANLQAQINSIITPVTQDAEVQNARTNASGTTFTTLKTRLDASDTAVSTKASQTEVTGLKEDLSKLNNLVGTVWHAGFINKRGSVSTLDASRSYSDFIICGESVSLKYIAESDHDNVCGISFYNKDFNFISGEYNVGNIGTEISTTAPAGTFYCRLSTRNEILSQSKVEFDNSQLAKVTKQITDHITVNTSNISQNLQKINSNTADIDINSTDICSTLKLVGKNSVDCVPFAIYSDKATVATDGTITVDAGGYHFTYYHLTSISDYALIETNRFVEVRYHYSSTQGGSEWSDPIGTHKISSTKYVVLVDKNATDTNYENFVVRIDNRTETSAISVKFSALNATVGTATINDINNAILIDKIEAGVYTRCEPVAVLNRSGCTFNADGTITIAAGGYYFPIFDSPLKMKSNCIVRVKTSGSHINISRNSAASGGGTTPYIVTNTVGEYEQAIIEKSTWDAEYPYMTLRIDNRTGTEALTISEIIVGDLYLSSNSDSNEKILYVSTTGNDDNAGTKSKPLATVNAALSLGASVVAVDGGVYEQTINLELATTPILEIRNSSTYSRVIFKPTSYIVSATETKVNGYEKIYSSPCTISFTDNNNWIWQEGIADADTLISDAERHPLQRGYAYRCEDTRLIKCSATDKNEALSEIDDYSGYKWFIDTTEGVIYYSRPNAVSETNPICYSSGGVLFSGGSKDISLKMVGIETKFQAINISETSTAEILECKASNIYGAGGFVYNRCRSAIFTRCEATNVHYGSTGDGFNGHSYNSGDKFSKQTVVTLLDCWSHDNNDDGYSDHERSEITIIGGLYEYNGKAGITPSYGSHCTCYNVYSRKNHNGFYYCGDVTESEGGKYGQMICYGCVAEDNTTRGSIKAGFCIQGTGNSAILVNCKSIGNVTGYYCYDNTSMTLIDCGGLNNTRTKYGNVTTKNTTVVS